MAVAESNTSTSVSSHASLISKSLKINFSDSDELNYESATGPLDPILISLVSIIVYIPASALSIACTLRIASEASYPSAKLKALI